MKVNVNKVRNFLSENKIFFEVIVASLLSFMAVYVSIQANIIAQNQTEIMKEENLPQLEIRMTQEYNEEIKLYDNKAWLFFNRGGRLSDFDTKEYSFLKFIHRPDYDTLLIPLHNYIDMRGVLTGDSEGLVYQVENNHQGKKEVEIRDSLSSFGFYNIEVYVAVSYSDIFDDNHVEYFQISPRIIKIKKNEWKKIESHFQNAKDRFTLSNLNAKTIINMRKNLRQ
ncbi:hypothetical protein [Dyadobacter sp. CY312]|uniref:hypothetical protein n=1 Tax=Dyadobacter sp. CY312 TaxID=2907303 RepID=UPI001F1672C1|nr:hypothetical protein [Dyadobacter sp. CY312]MCE7044656.1 hypothetical protein [Dyadobacter sp. CY312]